MARDDTTSLASESVQSFAQLSTQRTHGCKYYKRTGNVITRHSTRPVLVPSRTVPGDGDKESGNNDVHQEKRRKRSAPSSLHIESDKENIDPRSGCASRSAGTDELPARKKHQNRRLRDTRQPLKVLWSLERKTSDNGDDGGDDSRVTRSHNFALGVLR